MVQVTVTAALKVAGGPTLPLNGVLEPQSYTFASVVVEPAAEETVELLPQGGDVELLGVAARLPNGKPATIELTPGTGTAFDVVGSLLIVTPGVLSALVTGGPRSLKLKNDGTEPVTVDVLTGLAD